MLILKKKIKVAEADPNDPLAGFQPAFTKQDAVPFPNPEPPTKEPIEETPTDQPFTEPRAEVPNPEEPQQTPEQKLEQPAEEFKLSPVQHKPEDPRMLFQEVNPENTLEQYNARDTKEKIFYAMNNGLPLRISYTTLPYPDNPAGTTTIRMIEPEFVYWGGTNRHILVAMDHLRRDWRAFVVDNISNASLTELSNPQPQGEQNGQTANIGQDNRNIGQPSQQS